MPTSTLTPGDKKQDEKLNPGQRDYDRRFNDLSGAEKRGTIDMSDFERNLGENADSSEEDANAQRAKEQSGTWENNVAPTEYGNKSTAQKVKGWFKKSSPALGIGGVVGIAGLIMVGLSSPSLLIVQLKETMVGRFNTQLSSMEARTNRLIYTKINGATSGFCNAKVSIKCKFTTMTEKQVKKLKDAGIEVEGTKTITGRIKPTSMKHNDKIINARNFATTAGTDIVFRNALKQAYNPKFAGFSGKVWANVAAKFKISKQAPELEADEDVQKALSKVDQIAQEGFEDGGADTNRIVAGEKKDPSCEQNCDVWSESDAQAAQENVGKIKSSGDVAAAEVRGKLSGLNAGAVGSFVKITGPLDSACTLYGGMVALDYAAETIRAAQLVRYFAIFASTADKIKAGESPEPEDVALLGTILTTTLRSKDNPDTIAVGSATDSFGFKYAAYGDSSAPLSSMNMMNRALAGGGFTGELSRVTDDILQIVGGRQNAKKTCGVLANPVVQGVSIVAGIAALFIPGANVGAIVANSIGGVAVSTVIALLPAMLGDIVAGTSTKGIVGEESGNAITSGAGKLMSDALAAQNGNGPMSKKDAGAYNALHVETTDQYIADELQTTSPFDATNPHTFVGSIVARLLPLQSSSNPVTTIGSLLSTSLNSLIPKSQALSEEDYAKTLEICKDPDAIDAGYATDPFCNVIRGIPPKYLGKDPLLVVDELTSTGDLSEEGMPTGEYITFIDLCITNETPLGYSSLDTGFSTDEAKGCIISDENANYYLNYVDRIVNAGLDAEEVEENTAAVQPGALPQGSAAELAQMIVSSGNVTDATGQLQQIISGSRTDVSPDILSVLAALSASNKFTISSMKRDSALSVGAGNTSLHLTGRAADLSGAAGVNGVSFGYNGHDARVQAFLDTAVSLMPGNCDIGVPNQAYVNATKPKAKAGCIVFVDTGSAPHIHLDVRGGG